MITNKKKFLEEKVMIKNTKSRRLEKWAKTYLPLIHKGNRDDKVLRSAIFEGIPTELREVVWFKLIGNIHQDYTKLYEILLQLREDVAEKPFYKKNKSIVDKDLHRTYSSLEIFKPGNLLHEPLKNILTAFIVHRPDVGYVQGMSYLAAVLLMNLDEIQAFSLFLELTNWDILNYCFCFNMDKVSNSLSLNQSDR